MLIFAGVVSLLTNMKVVSWDVWEVIFLLWPFVFVAAGLHGLVQGESPVWQVFWIGAGALLVLGNLGYLAWSSWEIAARLWPLLLIAAGLNILTGRSNSGRLVGAGILVALMAGTALVVGRLPIYVAPLESSRISRPLDGAVRSDINLNLSAGRLILDVMPESAGQIEGILHHQEVRGVEQIHYVSQGTAHFTLRSAASTIWLPLGSARQQGNWALRVNPEVPLTLNIDLGAGEATVDLTGATLNRARITVGAGALRLTLPSEGRFESQIEGGVGMITVLIPRPLAMRLQANTALVDLDVPVDFVRYERGYRSPNLDQADRVVDLRVNLAVGRVTIRYLDE
ncbi:MAG: DUF5668 domain-containing protein [Anaerolineae bacterium]|nr:cell wall-active antibiotics response protein [Thermoflexales bacterium]MDW8408403.1 DUF5668 domain-containing protein [Anaerolineae bacterium]